MRAVLFASLALSIYAGDFPSLPADPSLNPLPGEVLAFPDFTENYRQKILGGDYEIWSEEKLQRWSSAQGLRVTSDGPGGGLQHRRAAIIAAPGLTFMLKRPVTEKGSEFANGWKLVLDIAAIRRVRGRYVNILDCDIWIDGVLYRRLTQSGSSEITSPVEIQIPHIRSGEGKVTVELRLANHPRNFLFLYDAYLAR